MPGLLSARTAAMLVLLSCAASAAAQNGGSGAPARVWPDPRYPSLQSAIDAAPEGATLRIARGTFRVEEPLFVRRNLRIVGAGSGLRARGNATRLVGPPPRPVVDERLRMVLPAAEVLGLINVVGANLEISALELSGFDAGIATPDPRGPAHLTIADVVIRATGRGVLALAPGAVHLRASRIRETLWNGLSMAPPPGQGSFLLAVNSFVEDLLGIGFYFSNTQAFLINQMVTGCACGGVVGRDTTGVAIASSVLAGNGRAGILLNDPQGFSSITGSEVAGTYENACLVGLGNGGQGIAVISSLTPAEPVWIVDNVVAGNASYGLGNHGSHVAIGDYAFTCNGVHLVGSDHVAGQFLYVNLEPSNVGCGCPDPTGACTVATAGLEPPDPAASLE
jgi:hypothetical protein